MQSSTGTPTDRLRALGQTHLRKQVQCIETGIIYVSVTEAAAALKISMASISNNARKEDGSTVKGLSFKFIDQ